VNKQGRDDHIKQLSIQLLTGIFIHNTSFVFLFFLIKLFFFLSPPKLYSYKNLDQHSLPTKAVIELLHTQYITFVIVTPFSPFVSKLTRAAVLASCCSAKY